MLAAILAFNAFYTIFGERLLAPSLVLWVALISAYIFNSPTRVLSQAIGRGYFYRCLSLYASILLFISHMMSHLEQAARLTMNIRRFTMDQGMAALGNIGSQARLSCRTIGEDHRVQYLLDQLYRSRFEEKSDDGLDDRKAGGTLVDFPQVLSKYLAAG